MFVWPLLHKFFHSQEAVSPVLPVDLVPQGPASSDAPPREARLQLRCTVFIEKYSDQETHKVMQHNTMQLTQDSHFKEK